MSYSNRIDTATFRVDPELWSGFKETCVMRGVSVCHVLEALMEAWIQGQKAEATLIRPVTVNLTMQHIVQRPRRAFAVPGPQQITQVGCISLSHREIWPGMLGWCHKVKRWITPDDCDTCNLRS